MQMLYLIPFLILFSVLAIVAYHYFFQEIRGGYLPLIGIPMAVSTLVSALAIYLMMSAKFTQVENLNGQVVGKVRDEVSCDHSYDCNCKTNKDGSSSCQTCYEHSFDVDWIVKTSVGDVEISREDRQGLVEPPDFRSAYVGEPASVENQYMDYLRASENTIYKKTGDARMPGIHSHYRLSHVIGCPAALDESLTKRMSQISQRTQTNVTAICGSKEPSDGLAEAKSIYHLKKNDVLVYLQVSGNNVVSASGTGLSKKTAYKQMLNDALAGKTLSDPEKIVDGIQKSINGGFERTPMEEFEYLKYDVGLAIWQIVVVFLIAAFSAALTLHLIYDEFSPRRNSYGFRY